ncbi:MAG: hypothetical protein ACLSAH_10785 [Bilophila wadsworthia]
MLDGAKVTVFPGKKDGKLVAVALEHFGRASVATWASWSATT